MTTVTDTPTTRNLRRGAFAPVAVAVLTTAGITFGAGFAEAEERRTRPGASCLWAGDTYQPGATIVAGGTAYSCGTDQNAPHWFSQGPTGKASTVRNPGAVTAPAGQFSTGARQPGTSYNDYCVTNQLIPGTDDVYQVVRVGDGTMMWKAAAPISQWKFDSARPEPTWRTGSLCYDGSLM
ncbi:MAG: hypothetical protein JWN03_1400 [Nocardia sp.]|uniref:hypothetical protein n=1 Tax=Nocardia sp. TaxID=1821 RepID=UPI002612B770|nr:hypothetical protein [Nocardia sp.]MCU1641125.1 hypothetical protein [Nocardia sp.]